MAESGAPGGRAPDQTRPAEETARDLGHEARDQAVGLRDAAVEHGRARAESAKDDFAGEVSSVGAALRRASSELRDGSPQSRAFASLADSVSDLADGMRDRNPSQMIDELSEFGRRNPAAFLGGAALLGFAAVRMARASRETVQALAVAPKSGSARVDRHRRANDSSRRRSDFLPVGGSTTRQQRDP